MIPEMAADLGLSPGYAVDFKRKKQAAIAAKVLLLKKIVVDALRYTAPYFDRFHRFHCESDEDFRNDGGHSYTVFTKVKLSAMPLLGP